MIEREKMGTEKSELIAYILIGVGVGLLLFTFATAFLILTSTASISTSSDLSKALGEILGPITEAIIKVMFLGIMGWTGSIATMRGIQLHKKAKTTAQSKTNEKQPIKSETTE